MGGRLYILSMILFVLCSLIIDLSHILAHPGRTDAYGCHTCRTNCHQWGLEYGEYHCHRAKRYLTSNRTVKEEYRSNRNLEEAESETPIISILLLSPLGYLLYTRLKEP